MRIIAGDLKGKKLGTIKGYSTRPTSDRLRETIFNILFNRFDGIFVLDLFAGTGALGIEALSRGATFSYFIDNSKEAVALIKKNLRSCRLEAKGTVIQWNIQKNLNCLGTVKNKFCLVFMDPPYNSNLLKLACMHLHHIDVLHIGASIIVEHSIDEPLPGSFKNYRITDQRIYRKTVLSVLAYDG